MNLLSVSPYITNNLLISMLAATAVAISVIGYRQLHHSRDINSVSPNVTSKILTTDNYSEIIFTTNNNSESTVVMSTLNSLLSENTTTNSPESESTTTNNPESESTTTSSPESESTTTSSLVSESTTTSSPESESTTTSSPESESTTTSSLVSESTTTSSPESESTTTSSPESESTTTSSLVSESTTTSSPESESTTTISPVSESTTTSSPVSESTTTISPESESTTTSSPASESTTTNNPKSESTTTNNPASESITSSSPASESTTTSSPASESTTIEEQGVSPHSEKLSANEDPEEFPNEDVFEHTFAEIPNIDHSNQTDEAIPETFDAREEWPQCKDVIGKVWDQGACQSCWAISAASVMSDRICIQSKGQVKPILSPQHLICSCTNCTRMHTKTPMSMCMGGDSAAAWMYWINAGLVDGGDYGTHDTCLPYLSRPCNHNPQKPANNGIESCTLNIDQEAYTCPSKCVNSNKSFGEEKKYFGSKVYYVNNSTTDIQKEIMQHGPVQAKFYFHDGRFRIYSTGE
ncbi:mucin-22 isoform X3 [Diaphorina citri]|uniref:Mucin-22 isoform X3 n=1 Tax=Diaphorina citri TaxID=121845 RepID=A0A1S4EBP6_DIACI|nr:mucin-22 isoform X3 [Diaphorina citri]